MRSRSRHPALVFLIIFVVVFSLHVPLLQLPYFWDEAGYYVPAARDLLLHGTLIPHTTVSNAHPPLVMAWLALWWKVFGYAPVVTRSAMLAVAAFALTGVFRLAQRVSNNQVAIASTVCTALYPVFFAQSSLAHLDLAAAGFTFWALCAYLEDRPVAVAAWFSLAALAKETAIIAPVALAGWELLRLTTRHVGTAALGCPVERSSTEPSSESASAVCTDVSSTALRTQRERAVCTDVSSTALPTQRERAALRGRESWHELTGAFAPADNAQRLLALLFPLLPLAFWFAYHYSRTGHVFGNPEFFRYNILATLNPLRFVLALLLRLWQAFVYMHMWMLTLAMLLAMLLPPIKDHVGTAALGCPVERSSTDIPRSRIAIPTQVVFYIVISAYVVVMALIGGAVLARYMLPAIPLVIIIAVSTLRRRLRHWTAAIALIVAAFILAWFWNPPYGFSPEDNLAYRDYIFTHEDAERFLEARYPMAHALTAWPASDELTRPWLGYVTRPVQVIRIEDFSLEQILSAADFRSQSPSHFEVALVFSTKYEPARPTLGGWTRFRWGQSLQNRWDDLKRRFFDYHRDLPPMAIAQMLGGHIVFSEERKGQWVAVIEMEKEEIQNAKNQKDKELFRLNGPAFARRELDDRLRAEANSPSVHEMRLPLPLTRCIDRRLTEFSRAIRSGDGFNCATFVDYEVHDDEFLR
jgi:hypothetical protein